MSRFSSGAKAILRHPLTALRALWRSRHGATDVDRWRELDNLRSDWEERTILIAGLIPAGARVLEFGAGRMVLRDHLPPGCSYQPSDLVPRGESTIVCDLNRGLPELPGRYTHTVFSGVLEYVVDPGSVVEALRSRTETIIASYATLDENPNPRTRRRSGWINHRTHAQLVELFEQRGFRLATTRAWRRQTIYLFERAE